MVNSISVPDLSSFQTDSLPPQGRRARVGPGKPCVRHARRRSEPRVNALSIVAHPQLKLPRFIPDFHFDPSR
jgi:hypothetical protein